MFRPDSAPTRARRRCALNVLSNHTYTHETLLNALDQHLRIFNVPIAARHVRGRRA